MYVWWDSTEGFLRQPMSHFAAWLITAIAVASMVVSWSTAHMVGEHAAAVEQRNAQLVSDVFDARTQVMQLKRQSECQADPVQCLSQEHGV